MRLTLVALVFTFHSVRGGDLNNLSGSSKLQSADKILRNKPEFQDARSEDPKNTLTAPQLVRKDFLNEILKRRCNICMESLKCKQLGKCDHCVRVCKEYDPTMFPTETQAPVVGSVQQQKEHQPVTLRYRNTVENLLNSLGSGWYYTVDSFGSNSKQNLLVRLLNIARKDKLEKLVVLAKAKEAIDGEGPGNSLVVDSANVFKRNASSNDIIAEVHTIDGSKVPHAADLELASKIDGELSKAMKVKKKTTGQPYLTTQEIDKIIDQALATFNYKIMPSSSVPTATEDNILLGSRHNIPETFSSTTRRSISGWKFLRNTDNLLRKPLGQVQQPKLNPNAQKQTHSINRNARIPALDNLPMNKRTISKPYEQPPASESPNDDVDDNDNEEDSSSADEDSTSGDDDNNDDTDEDEDLPVYELEPASNYVKEEQDARNTPQEVVSPPSVRVTDKKPGSPQVLNVPINQSEKPQSANQYAEQPTQVSNSESDDYDDDENFSNERLSLAAPQLSNNKLGESGETIPVEKTAKNSSHESITQNSTDPLLGRSWIEDEWNKARNWWNTDVGLETPKTLSNNSNDIKEDNNLQTSENIHMEESQVNMINASYFTLILKNLERKVENIADLVKKTCGQTQREETVGQRDPFYASNNLKDPPKNDTESSERLSLPIPGRKTIHIIGMSNPETTTPSTQTEEIGTNRLGPRILNEAINRLNKETEYLINKAKDITKPLQENPVTQKSVDNILGSRKNHEQDSDSSNACNKDNSKEFVGNSRKDCENCTEDNLNNKSNTPATFENKVPTNANADPQSKENVACSKEEPEEYVGERSQSQHKNTSKKNKGNSCIEEKSAVDDQNKQRSTLPQEGASHLSSDKESPQDDTIECSKEEPEQYVGARKEDSTLETTTAKNTEEVGCSKEDDEEYPVYSGYRKSEANPKTSNSEVPKLKPLLNIPALSNLLHRSQPAHHHKEESNPSEKHAAHNFPSILDEEQANMPKMYAPNHKFGSEVPASIQKIINPHAPERQEEPASQQAAHAQHKQFHITMPTSPLDESRILPSSAPDQEYKSHAMPPSLSQRFSDHEFMGDDFQETIPQSARSWTSMQSQNDVVGSEKDSGVDDDTDSSIATPSKSSFTPNPFSIFGKVVPQLNNTEISFHHIPSNKIYFVGAGMQLPLNMKRHDDGSYQLSVDIDKLCNNCNENSCKNSAGETVGAAKNESDQKSINDDDDDKTEITNKEDKDTEHKTPRYKPNIHKIEILSMDTPKLRNRRVPLRQHITDERTLQETDPKSDLFNNEEFQQHSFFVSDLDAPQHRHSDISKRSPKLDSVFPILQKRANINEHETPDYHKRPFTRTNSITNLNETLKRIHQNLKRYHAKRAQTDGNYKQQNKSELSNPNGKREVKKGFAVVNDILTWMKNIASRNTKT